MVAEKRDELMKEIGLHYVLGSAPWVMTDAIIPIIERFVAAETERCASVADHFSAFAYSEGLSEDVVIARGYMASDISIAIRKGSPE